MIRFCSLCVLSLCTLGSSALAQGSPYCAADLVFDNTLDFFDISELLDAYNNQDPKIDFNNDGIIDFFDVSDFIQMLTGDCPDLTDFDGDRLPDFVETDNGLFVDAFSTGSDPFNADTDDDGLDDGDEVLGTLDGVGFPGASPVYRDIYVECDWFAGTFEGRVEDYRPTPGVEARIADAFALASSSNPYGQVDGINLHLDYGQGNGFDGGNQLPGQPVFLLFDSDFNQYKAAHFDPNRKGYYHYAIFANRYNSPANRSSGIAELNGDDFMVTMVDYNSTVNMANTIAHELGHNLGLRHGGFEARNRKPNYNSVMNYRHQFPGIDITGNARGDGVLDYSHGFNIDLDESALIDADGVNGVFAIDWNRNGVMDPLPYGANINCNSVFSFQDCGVLSNCYDNTCDVLRDHDDWGNINWNRLTQSTDRQPGPEHIECDNWPGKY